MCQLYKWLLGCCQSIQSSCQMLVGAWVVAIGFWVVCQMVAQSLEHCQVVAGWLLGGCLVATALLGGCQGVMCSWQMVSIVVNSLLECCQSILCGCLVAWALLYGCQMVTWLLQHYQVVSKLLWVVARGFCVGAWLLGCYGWLVNGFQDVLCG